MELSKSIGKQVRELRLKHKMSQMDLALRMCSCQANISKLERGEANITIDFLERIAAALDESVSVIIGASTESPDVDNLPVDEILRHFRRGNYSGRQIQIVAEMYDCSPKKILHILKLYGRG